LVDDVLTKRRARNKPYETSERGGELGRFPQMVVVLHAVLP